jgi:gliding motility-associated lipoprotein GldH
MSKRRIIPVFLLLILPLIFFLGSGCGKNNGRELYHRFPGKSWERFNMLSFEIPIEKGNVYDVYLFARFANSYPYETLDFNMVMNTPAGEERINEYQMEVKNKSGNFCIECSKDSCMGTILLKREINIARPGVLKIEIENLTPRILTEGVLGVGIRWMPSGK